MRGTVLTNIGDVNFNIAWVNNYEADAAPTVNDDSGSGYSVGSQWVYNNTIYTCFDATPGAAVWVASSDTTPGTVNAPNASTPTGTGGAASIKGGSGGTTSGAGGSTTVSGGDAAAGNSNGGSAIIQGGAKSGTGLPGSVRQLGVVLKAQGAQVTQDTAATLTGAQLLNGIIQSTPGGAINLTLPLQADMDAAVPDAATNDSFDFSIINTSGGANTITVVANSWATVGALTIEQNVSGRFRARKTGAGAWTLYRLS